ncbi:ATP-binding cassette domain-containing protein [Pseudonocardia eucalypti]|uniref:ATP-binding cassette domain-containing protein n=1 Tax=Pseudonocardia eucalypti TaxID=648755 RepID=A0ABP9PH59_9PSEU|nr:molybdate transport system ATP-binding protein [Pseudonocardia eucalypti]
MTFVEAGVTVRRREFTLDVSVSLAKGEVLAVLGPNGAGKSTLLGVLAGLLRPDAGRVRLGDRVLTDVPAGVHVPAHRRGVGLLAQRSLLFPHLTAEANVAFGPRCAGVRRAKAGETARHWLAEVDAAELGHRRPSALSGGQAQRVALARALAVSPELLLLDEPLAALDVDSAPAMRALLHRVVRDAGTTGLLVTHDVLDALVLADQVAVLADGSIVEYGPTREVLTRPRSPFAARIAGLNLVPGVAVPGGLRTADGLLVAGLAADGGQGKPAVAVFPPAAVAVFPERPEGSPRNVLRVRLASLEPRGELVRLRAGAAPGDPPWVDGLAADVTPAAVADLALDGTLAPGADLWFAVKTTEVLIHPA